MSRPLHFPSTAADLRHLHLSLCCDGVPAVNAATNPDAECFWPVADEAAQFRGLDPLGEAQHWPLVVRVARAAAGAHFRGRSVRPNDGRRGCVPGQSIRSPASGCRLGVGGGTRIDSSRHDTPQNEGSHHQAEGNGEEEREIREAKAEGRSLNCE